MWNSSGVQQNLEQGESVLAGQVESLHGGGAERVLADSQWVVRVESGLHGGFAWDPESLYEGNKCCLGFNRFYIYISLPGTVRGQPFMSYSCSRNDLHQCL